MLVEVMAPLAILTDLELDCLALSVSCHLPMYALIAGNNEDLSLLIAALDLFLICTVFSSTFGFFFSRNMSFFRISLSVLESYVRILVMLIFRD